MNKHIWWLGILFFLIGCTRNDYSDLLLSDCQLPCWQGITPGETSVDEVNDLLEKAEDLEEFWKRDHSNFAEIGATFENGTRVDLLTESGVVAKIWLSKADIWHSNYKYPPIRLGETLISTGFPDGFFVGSLSGGRHTHAFLRFDDLHMVISVEITSNEVDDNLLYTITEDDSVMIINFFAPEIYEEELQIMKEEYGWPLPVIEFSWKGYGDY